MFHYHQILIDELAKQYQVFFFPDQPKDPLTALKRKLHRTFSARYYERLFEQVKNEQFEVFLCINGKGITREFIEKLRSLNESAKFITYQWDSIARNKIERKTDYLYFLDLFDKCYSFDPNDVSSVDRLHYLPTYHNTEARNPSKNTKSIDLLLIASYTKERYRFIKKHKEDLLKQDYSFQYYLYLPWHHYVRNLLLKGEFLDPKLVRFTPMSKKSLFEKYEQARVLLDIQYKHQSGFTMRIMEGLAHGCKILSTNTALQKEQFNQNNMGYFNLEHFKIESDLDLLNSSFQPDNTIKNLHIRQWAQTILA